jgi:hypothetical protein
MAYNYSAMSDICTPLEIGRHWVMNKRKIAKTKGNRKLVGRNNAGDRTNTTEGLIDPKESNFGNLLNDFFESKVYEKYLVDNGEIKVTENTSVDINKAAGLLLKVGSAV